MKSIGRRASSPKGNDIRKGATTYAAGRSCGRLEARAFWAGFFPGPFNGADVTVKDTKRYTETNGWGYYNFNHFEPKAATATVRPLEECAYCHIASAKRDDVWTQFYGLLDSVPVPADQKKK